eukprot:scaffold36200_cov63-Phaeocystis_antarctica.AAC.11
MPKRLPSVPAAVVPPSSAAASATSTIGTARASSLDRRCVARRPSRARVTTAAGMSEGSALTSSPCISISSNLSPRPWRHSAALPRAPSARATGSQGLAGRRDRTVRPSLQSVARAPCKVHAPGGAPAAMRVKRRRAGHKASRDVVARPCARPTAAPYPETRPSRATPAPPCKGSRLGPSPLPPAHVVRGPCSRVRARRRPGKWLPRAAAARGGSAPPRRRSTRRSSGPASRTHR